MRHAMPCHATQYFFSYSSIIQGTLLVLLQSTQDRQSDRHHCTSHAHLSKLPGSTSRHNWLRGRRRVCRAAAASARRPRSCPAGNRRHDRLRVRLSVRRKSPGECRLCLRTSRRRRGYDCLYLCLPVGRHRPHECDLRCIRCLRRLALSPRRRRDRDERLVHRAPARCDCPDKSHLRSRGVSHRGLRDRNHRLQDCAPIRRGRSNEGHLRCLDIGGRQDGDQRLDNGLAVLVGRLHQSHLPWGGGGDRGYDGLDECLPVRRHRADECSLGRSGVAAGAHQRPDRSHAVGHFRRDYGHLHGRDGAVGLCRGGRLLRGQCLNGGLSWLLGSWLLLRGWRLAGSLSGLLRRCRLVRIRR